MFTCWERADLLALFCEGPDALVVVRPTGVYLLDFFAPVFSLTSKFREFMSPAIIVYYLNEKK